MESIEIDPELFITCRICFKEKGSYQITPILQEQIKYCLDIEVSIIIVYCIIFKLTLLMIFLFQIQPFDGFSQVICKKCKPILDEFHKIKKNAKEKHEKLSKNVKPIVVRLYYCLSLSVFLFKI